jgi:hypothetical protein
MAFQRKKLGKPMENPVETALVSLLWDIAALYELFPSRPMKRPEEVADMELMDSSGGGEARQ